MRKNYHKIILTAVISLAVIFIVFVLGVGIGSVYISPENVINVIFHKLFGAELNAENISNGSLAIIFSFRIPRVILAFVVGAALAVCGAVIQSVLTNPLASPFTLGSSSGASFGAALVIAFEITLFGKLTLPIFGIVFSIATIFTMIFLSDRIDKGLKNSTIILTGMVVSLFLSSIVTVIANTVGEKYSYILKWQTGNLVGKSYFEISIVSIVFALCFVRFFFKSSELDILTFGNEQASSIGVNTKKIKFEMLILTAVLSGVAVSFTGVIGFIDLISSNIARRIFGAKHIILLPMSAVIGGVFMVCCDIIARTVITPNELPIGAVTSLLGAPFFIFSYISSRKKALKG